MLPLGLNVDPKNELLVDKLKELENYDFDHITRDASQKFGWSIEKTKSVESDVRQFLSLSFLDPDYYHIPSPDVDEYWHRMILHTNFYVEFCDAVFGEYYHHNPIPHKEVLDDALRDRTLKLVPYWFNKEWDALVMTCTQCRGPAKISAIKEMAPHQSTIPSFR